MKHKVLKKYVDMYYRILDMVKRCEVKFNFTPLTEIVVDPLAK